MFRPSGPSGNVFDFRHLMPDVEVFPENWPVVRLFSEMSGQWRAGSGGLIALDYTPLFARMDKMGLAGDEWEDMFACIRIMEAAALEEMKTE